MKHSPLTQWLKEGLRLLLPAALTMGLTLPASAGLEPFPAAVAPALATASPAVALTFTTIDFPGAAQTFCLAINARGQMVGGYLDAGGNQHGFLLNQGT